MDVQLLRLQYEILNTPVEELAEDAGVPTEIMLDEIKHRRWTRRWPSEPTISADSEAMQKEVGKAQSRLKLYLLEKEMYLASKYLALESSLVNRALDASEEFTEPNPKDLKILSGIYKDLTSNKIDFKADIPDHSDDDGLAAFPREMLKLMLTRLKEANTKPYLGITQ